MKLLKTNKDMIGYVVETSPGEIVGYVLGGPERTGNPLYKGEVYAIYLLSDYQRRGFGEMMFKTLCKELSEQGMNSLLVWVLKDSPYRKFYSSLGGKEVNYQTEQHECSQWDLVAYGWKEI